MLIFLRVGEAKGNGQNIFAPFLNLPTFKGHFWGKGRYRNSIFVQYFSINLAFKVSISNHLRCKRKEGERKVNKKNW